MCNGYIAKLEENNLKENPKDALARMDMYDKVEQYYRKVLDTFISATKKYV